MIDWRMILACVIGGSSQSISQNMGPSFEAVSISNVVNAAALWLAFSAGKRRAK